MSAQTQLNFDITRRKSHGSGLSDEANKQVQKSADQVLVLAHIVSEPRGLTLHEIALKTGKAVNSLSGRISELIADGEIYRVVESTDLKTGKVKYARRLVDGHWGSVLKVSK